MANLQYLNDYNTTEDKSESERPKSNPWVGFVHDVSDQSFFPNKGSWMETWHTHTWPGEKHLYLTILPTSLKSLLKLWRTARGIPGNIFPSSQICHYSPNLFSSGWCFWVMGNEGNYRRIPSSKASRKKKKQKKTPKKLKDHLLIMYFSISIFSHLLLVHSLLLWCGYQKQSLQDSSSAKANRPKIGETIYLNPRVVIQFIWLECFGFHQLN